MQKCMDDYFSTLSPRESEFCKDCKYSEISINNGNLLCLHEKSRHFGTAITPEQDMKGFCYFEGEKEIDINDLDKRNEEENYAVYNNQTTAPVSSDHI